MKVYNEGQSKAEKEKDVVFIANQNNLETEYTGIGLFWYTVPSILSLLFLSLYQMVDALFVANVVSENALASINIVYPVISVVLAVTLMFSTGGSAIVARKLGEGKTREAKEDFTVLLLAIVLLATVVTVVSIVFIQPLLKFMGATEALWETCYDYLSILIWFMPAAALQMAFSTFFVTAGKPGIAFLLTVISGITNIVLDYIFIVQIPLGISGAAWGTAASYCIAAIPGILYFALQRKGLLYFVKPVLRIKMLGFACFNGSSEMVSNLAVSITTLLFNKLTLYYIGEGGVAAITVILYAQFLLTAVFLGSIAGAVPVISFQLGRGNAERLAALFRCTFCTTMFLTVLILFGAYWLARPIVAIYIRPESSLFPLALHGFLLYSINYCFAGFNIYASGLFTALQNGKLSAMISGLRTFVFLVLALLMLPIWLDADGIWLAVPLAEGLSCIVAVGCMIRHRKKYYFHFQSKALKEG